MSSTSQVSASLTIMTSLNKWIHYAQTHVHIHTLHFKLITFIFIDFFCAFQQKKIDEKLLINIWISEQSPLKCELNPFFLTVGFDTFSIYKLKKNQQTIFHRVYRAHPIRMRMLREKGHCMRSKLLG